MDNNMNNTDREKLLEEILASVGRNNTTDNRAARVAASSANRAAAQKRSYSSQPSSNIKTQPHTSFETASKQKESSVISLPKKESIVSPEKTGRVKRNTASAPKRTEKTGSTPHTPAEHNTAAIEAEKRYVAEREDRLIRDDSSRIVRTLDPETEEKTRSNSKKHRRMSGRLPIVLIVTTIIFTVAISLSMLIIYVGRDMLAIGKSDDIKIVNIPEGANTEEVAQILYDEGIIKIPKAFIFISKIGGSDTKYIAGEHELSPSNAYETIIYELTTDKSLEKETVDITFYEGCDLISAANQLEEEGVCAAERFLYYFNAGDYGYEFEDYLPASTSYKFNRMEGYLFPDTYTFYVDTDPEVVCQKIYKNFNDKFKPEYYTKMKEMNMTLDEVITLASIVQAESADVKTMKKIASVFENRLANPEEYPKLQSDPTTYYVTEVIKPNIEIPSEAIFEAYDTYQTNGLPPGAIGNPGTDAIEAVLYPEKTDYYFFYANIDTKETYFAKTDEEQEENKKMVMEQQQSDESAEENGEE